MYADTWTIKPPASSPPLTVGEGLSLEIQFGRTATANGNNVLRWISLGTFMHIERSLQWRVSDCVNRRTENSALCAESAVGDFQHSLKWRARDYMSCQGPTWPVRNMDHQD